MKKIIAFLISALITSNAFAAIQIVAAENFYGDVAQSIGGNHVSVYSIMRNPNQDPHIFSASPEIAERVAQANVVIENGVGYDAWMNHIYAASAKKAVLINVGHLMGKKPGANPHIWYNPETMPVFAKTLTLALSKLDPANEKTYQKNLQVFLKQSTAYQEAVATVRKQVAGMSIAATEPVFGYLAAALGLKVLDQKFQWDLMNGTDLSPSEVSKFIRELNTKAVKLLVYNSQVIDPTTVNIRTLALKDHIPVVGVSETMPPKQHYYSWMYSELTAVASALKKS